MATCTITILDEVNCTLQNLTLDTRKKLHNKFKFEIPGARYMPACRLGRWDGKKTFFSLAAQSYVHLLDEIIPIVIREGYDAKLIDCRVEVPQLNFTAVDEHSFANINWPVGHAMAGQPIVLRDYQVAAINIFLETPQALQEISTAAGKTLITAALSKLVEPYGRSIVIVPQRSLVEQTEIDYRNMGLDVGVYFGSRKEFGKVHTICTWQSLNILTKNKDADNTMQDFLKGVVCVIVDECHTLKADVLMGMLTGAMANIPIRWGFTGTMPKEECNFTSLKVSIGPTVGGIKTSELQDKGVISNCHIDILQLMDLVDYPDYQAELKYLTTNERRIDYISGRIDNIKNKGGNTLVLVDRIETGNMLSEKLNLSRKTTGNTSEVVFISGSTKGINRAEHYDKVSATTNTIIVATYGVAAVGINIPSLHNVVLIEPGKSFIRVIQSIGRGLRKTKDKDFVNIYDITSSCKFSKRHLTTRKKYYAEANYPYSVTKQAWR